MAKKVQNVDGPNAEPNYSLGMDDPISQRRLQQGRYYLSEIAPIVNMDTGLVLDGAQDFFVFSGGSKGDGVSPVEWEFEKREWASAILLQNVGVTFNGADGKPVRVTVNEIAPFLKKGASEDDFPSSFRAKSFAQKLTGTKAETLAELIPATREEIALQDPIVQLQATNKRDWKYIRSLVQEGQPA